MITLSRTQLIYFHFLLKTGALTTVSRSQRSALKGRHGSHFPEITGPSSKFKIYVTISLGNIIITISRNHSPSYVKAKVKTH